MNAKIALNGEMPSRHNNNNGKNMMRIRYDTVDVVAQAFVSYETARLCP